MRTEGTPKGESRKLKSRDKKIRDRLFSCRANWQRSNFLPPGQEIRRRPDNPPTGFEKMRHGPAGSFR